LRENYLLGFEATWVGAEIGVFEESCWGLGWEPVLPDSGYAKLVRWREERDDRRHLRDKM